MRRLILYVAAATVLVSLVTITLAISTHLTPPPLCPHCRAANAQPGTLFDTATIYTCRSCRETFYGPARQEIPWMDAIEEWLDDTPAIQ